MKNTIYALFAAVAVILAASCSKDLTTDEGLNTDRETVRMTFTAAFAGEDTKVAAEVSASSLKYTWEEGDAIAVWDGTAVRKLNLVSGAGTASATFSGAVTSSPTGYSAVYPYSDSVQFDGDGLTVEFPARQQAEANSIDPKALIFAAQGNTSFSFQPMVTVMKVDIEQDGFTSFMFRGNDGEAVSGVLSLQEVAAGVFAPVKTEASSDAVIVTPATAGKKGTYYFAYAPQEMSEGFSLAVKDDAAGKRGVKYSVKPVDTTGSFGAGKGQNLGTISGLGWISDSISTAEELSAWGAAARYAYSSFDTVELAADIDFAGQSWPTVAKFFGFFNGNEHVIKNIKIDQVASLGDHDNFVAFIGRAVGPVRNLTIGAAAGDSSEITLNDTGVESKQLFMGVIGQTGKGDISKVKNFAPVTVNAACKYMTVIGGVIGGTMEGGKAITISGCENNGKVVCRSEAIPAESDPLPQAVGGVMGLNSTVDNLRLESCINNGDVTNFNPSTFLSGGQGTINVGGVMCYTLFTTYFVECENYGHITNSASPYKRTSGYMTRVGGILASGFESAQGTVLTRCNNYGLIDQDVEMSAAGSIAMGGILGHANDDSMTIEGCINCGNVTPTSATFSSGASIGGIVGYGNKTKLKICSDAKGNITYNNSNLTIKTNFKSSVNIAGILGCAASPDGIIDGCTNFGNIQSSATQDADVNYQMGGIVGICQSLGIYNCTNIGKIDAYGAENTSKFFIGGIISGYHKTADYRPSRISNCTNSGALNIHKGVSASYCGGIAAYWDPGYTELDYCTSTGSLIMGRNNAVRVGGIAAQVVDNNTGEPITTAIGCKVDVALQEYYSAYSGMVVGSYTSTGGNAELILGSSAAPISISGTYVSRNGWDSTHTTPVSVTISADNVMTYLSGQYLPNAHYANTTLGKSIVKNRKFNVVCP